MTFQTNKETVSWKLGGELEQIRGDAGGGVHWYMNILSK